MRSTPTDTWVHTSFGSTYTSGKCVYYRFAGRAWKGNRSTWVQRILYLIAIPYFLCKYLPVGVTHGQEEMVVRFFDDFNTSIPLEELPKEGQS